MRGLGNSPDVPSGVAMRKRASVAGNVAPLADFLSGAVAFVTVLRRGTSDAERAEAINASPSLSTCFSTWVGA